MESKLSLSSKSFGTLEITKTIKKGLKVFLWGPFLMLKSIFGWQKIGERLLRGKYDVPFGKL